MASALHHLHVRKRIHQKHQTYPHPDKLRNFLDKCIYGGAVIGPLFILPQVIAIWGAKNAAGVSFIAWLAFLVGSMFWLLYGVLHKEKPIIVANLLCSVFNFAIVLGIVFFGKIF